MALLRQSDSSRLRMAAMRLLVFTLCFSLATAPSLSYAQTAFLNLPLPGTMVSPSAAFVPVLLKGMTIHPDNPLRFDFIVDSGNTTFSPPEVQAESERLVKYFLAAMTVPQDDLWVNLSPGESDRIIPDELGKTELGRDMLAQDYLLKQMTASLMYPEKGVGRKFWQRVRAQARQQFGTSDIPVDTFNKVWIIPEQATVYENDQTVYVVGSRLKVLLDEDYLALQDRQNGAGPRASADQSAGPAAVSGQIVREIILPELEREVNQGANFAPLRQIYHSLILAKWYKATIKDSLLSAVYIDQNKTAGIDLNDPAIKDKIYAQYMQAYEQGVFNFIKEDYDQLSQTTIPRKYFSGGEWLGKIPIDTVTKTGQIVSSAVGDQYQLAMGMQAQTQQSGMSGEAVSSPVTEAGAGGRETLSAQQRDAFDEVLAHFGIVGARNPHGLGGGVASVFRPVRFESADGSMKVLRMLDKPVEQLKFIISVQQHLADVGLPVPRLLAKRESGGQNLEDYFVRYQDAFYVIEELLTAGEQVRVADLKEDHFRGIGQLAARINNALRGFNPEGRKSYLMGEQQVEKYADSIRVFYEFLSGQTGDRDLIELMRENHDFIWQQIKLFRQRYHTAGLDEGIVFNDLHAGNMRFFSDGQVAGLLDFDFVQSDVRVAEFNNMVLGRDAISAGLPYSYDKLLAMVAAYESVVDQPLSDRELYGVVEIMRLRMIQEVFRRFTDRGFQLPFNALDHPEQKAFGLLALATFKQFANDFRSDDDIERFIRQVRSQAGQIKKAMDSASQPGWSVSSTSSGTKPFDVLPSSPVEDHGTPRQSSEDERYPADVIIGKLQHMTATVAGKRYRLSDLFSISVVREGLSLEQHTRMVMQQFERYFRGRDLPRGMTRDFMRWVLALHDVGKPIKNDRGAHANTQDVIRDLYTQGQLPWTAQQLEIALALIDGDLIGDFLRTRVDLPQTASKIAAQAARADMPIQDFFYFKTLYYQSDTASYTQDAGSSKAALDGLYFSVVEKERFFSIVGGREALQRLIGTGVLSEVSGNVLRLNRMKDEIVPRPEALAGADFDEIWVGLARFQLDPRQRRLAFANEPRPKITKNSQQSPEEVFSELETAVEDLAELLDFLDGAPLFLERSNPRLRPEIIDRYAAESKAIFLHGEDREEAWQRFGRLNGTLKDLPRLNHSGRLYFLTEWASQLSPKLRRAGYVPGAAFDENLIANLTDGPVVDFFNYVAQARHVEPRLQVTPNTLKHFLALSLNKQAAYVGMLTINEFPVFSENVYSDRFLVLYKDVRDEDVDAFLTEALRMSWYYLFNQFPQVRDRFIPADLLSHFITISELRDLLPELRRQFFIDNKDDLAETSGRFNVRGILDQVYQLKTLPGQRLTIDDLYRFVNSDNFSIFRAFSFQEFPASEYPFIRDYQGLPLTILHGTSNIATVGRILNDKRLRAINPKSPRNGKYIFFGTPYHHFSRNPQAMALGSARYWGNVAFEFPVSVLHKDSRDLMNVRGTFLSHPFSKVRLKEGLPIPDDIVQLGAYPVPLSEATRIYYETEEEKKILQDAIDENHWKAQLVAQKDAEQVYRQMQREAFDLVRQFETSESNQALLEEMGRARQTMEGYLIGKIKERILGEAVPALVEDFVKQYAVMTLSDLLPKTRSWVLNAKGAPIAQYDSGYWKDVNGEWVESAAGDADAVQVASFEFKPGEKAAVRMGLFVDEALFGDLRAVDRGSNAVLLGSQGLTQHKDIHAAHIRTVEDIRDEIEAGLAAEGVDRQILSTSGNENLYYNLPVVAFRDGRVFYARRIDSEFYDLEAHAFPMVVMWADGRVTIERDVRFRLKDGPGTNAAEIFLPGSDAPRTDIRAAAFLQLVKWDEEFIDPGQPGTETILWYDDLKHLFSSARFDHQDFASIPREMGMSNAVFFGFEEMARDPDVARAAVNGAVTLPLSLPYITPEEQRRLPEVLARKLIETLHYQEVTDRAPLARGEFRLRPGSGEIEIFFKENPYPFHVLGMKPDGTIVEFAMDAVYGQKGPTVRSLFDFLRQQGISRAGIIDQGISTRLTVGDEELLVKPGARARGVRMTSMFYTTAPSGFVTRDLEPVVIEARGARTAPGPGVTITDDVVHNSQMQAAGQFIVMEPDAVDIEVSVEPEMVARDLVDNGISPTAKEGAGRTVREFVDESPRQDEILMAFNSIVGNYYAPNSLTVVEGQLVRKPDDVKGVMQVDGQTPLNGEFWFLPFDAGAAPALVPVTITDGALPAGFPYQNGVFGPVIVRGAQSNLQNLVFERFPEVAANELNFPRTKRQAMSAMGYTKDGKIFRATLIGDPNDLSRSPDGSEPSIDEFVDYLLRNGVESAILMGTVADVKTYIGGEDPSYTEAQEKKKIVTVDLLRAAGLAEPEDIFQRLSTLDWFVELEAGRAHMQVINVKDKRAEILGLFEDPALGEKVLAVLATVRGSFLGDIFFPRSRPNATHVTVYKRQNPLPSAEAVKAFEADLERRARALGYQVNDATKYILHLGDTVDQSRYHRIFNRGLSSAGINVVFVPVQTMPEELAERMAMFKASDKILGVNTTSPHKVAVKKFVTAWDRNSEVAGSINGVVKNADGTARGLTSDGPGWVYWYTHYLKKSLDDKRVVILGAGGAARSLIVAITDQAPGAQVVLYDRDAGVADKAARDIGLAAVTTVHNKYQLNAAIADADIVINLTGSGKGYDDRQGDGPDLEYGLLAGKIVIDGNYRFKYGLGANEFLRKAHTAGAAAIYNGLGFLVGTIPPLFKAFTGQDVDYDAMMTVAKTPEAEGGVGLIEAEEAIASSPGGRQGAGGDIRGESAMTQSQIDTGTDLQNSSPVRDQALNRIAAIAESRVVNAESMSHLKEEIDTLHALLERDADAQRWFDDLTKTRGTTTEDFFEFLRPLTLLGVIGAGKTWNFASKGKAGDGSWWKMIAEQPDFDLKVPINRLEHFQAMVGAVDRFLGYQFAGMEKGFYKEMTGRDDVRTQPQAIYPPQGGKKLSTGKLAELRDRIGEFVPEQLLILQLGAALHDYGRLMEGRGFQIRDDGEIVADDNGSVQHRDSGAILARGLLTGVGFSDSAAERVIQFLIRRHDVLWSLYAGEVYGPEWAGGYQGRASLNQEIQKLIGDLDTDLTRQDILKMLAVIAVADVHASGDRYLSDQFVDFILAMMDAPDPVDPDQPGGIDMNEINIEHQGAGVDIHFDPVMMQDMLENGVEGFAPVFINFTPIQSLLPILGLAPRGREEEFEVSQR